LYFVLVDLLEEGGMMRGRNLLDKGVKAPGKMKEELRASYLHPSSQYLSEKGEKGEMDDQTMPLHMAPRTLNHRTGDDPTPPPSSSDSSSHPPHGMNNGGGGGYYTDDHAREVEVQKKAIKRNSVGRNMLASKNTSPVIDWAISKFPNFCHILSGYYDLIIF